MEQGAAYLLKSGKKKNWSLLSFYQKLCGFNTGLKFPRHQPPKSRLRKKTWGKRQFLIREKRRTALVKPITVGQGRAMKKWASPSWKTTTQLQVQLTLGFMASCFACLYEQVTFRCWALLRYNWVFSPFIEEKWGLQSSSLTIQHLLCYLFLTSANWSSCIHYYFMVCSLIFVTYIYFQLPIFAEVASSPVLKTLKTCLDMFPCGLP